MQSRVHRSSDVPVQAPIGGLNTRDAFDDIPATDAIILDNWIPGLGAVEVRGGKTVFCDSSDIPSHEIGIVETLMTYDATAVKKLIASDGPSVYDTNDGAPIILGDGFGSSRWSWTNFEGYLIMVNGDSNDAPQEYDGATLQPLNPPLEPALNPIGCHAFKNRMYYWENASQDVWYTELYARGGDCNRFQLSRLTKFGGDLLAMATWTHDGGTGPDDHLVFIMTSGEVLVYQGSSPASISNWALVGIYYIGTPLGDRCVAKFGGDLLIVTALDVVSLSDIIKGPEALAKRSKAAGAFEEVAEFAGSPFFDITMFPKKKLGIFNVPAPGGKQTYQYVQNMVTGAWCRFTGWDAFSWAVIDDDIYFGGTDGIVYRAFDGFVDEYMNGKVIESSAIFTHLQTAWLNFGSPMNKAFHAIKPIMQASGVVSLNAAFATDFAPFSNVETPSPPSTVGTPWGSPWGSPWGISIGVSEDWEIIEGYGRWISMQAKTASTSPLRLASTIWHIEAGSAM